MGFDSFISKVSRFVAINGIASSSSSHPFVILCCPSKRKASRWGICCDAKLRRSRRAGTLKRSSRNPGGGGWLMKLGFRGVGEIKKKGVRYGGCR